MVLMYTFLENEINQRREEPVEVRVMYDDINENFWQRVTIDLLLPLNTAQGGGAPNAAEQARGAYIHLRKVFSNPEKAAKTLIAAGMLPKSVLPVPKGRHPLCCFFFKTYLERPGWAHCFHVFGRVLAWHAIFFHALLAAALAWGPQGLRWQDLNVVCITHAACKILRQLIDLRIGHPPRHVESRAFGAHALEHSHKEAYVLIALYSLVPMIYLLEKQYRRSGTTVLYDAMVRTVCQQPPNVASLAFSSSAICLPAPVCTRLRA